jgi:hypothetical protein
VRNLSGSLTVGSQQWAPGVYFCSVMDSNGRKLMNQKLIITK